MADQEVEWEVEPLFDDVDVGDLEGWKIEDYRTWKHSRAGRALSGRREPERCRAALRRAFQALLAGPRPRVLVVTHEIPIRYALNGLGGSPTLDGPAHEIPKLRAVPLRRRRAAASRRGNRNGRG